MKDTELYHYGVKGMKWGVRRAEKKAERARLKALKDEYKAEQLAIRRKNYEEKQQRKLDFKLSHPVISGLATVGKAAGKGAIRTCGALVVGAAATTAAVGIGHYCVAKFFSGIIDDINR